MSPIFVIYLDLAVFVKIATLKGPLCHLIWIFANILANVRQIRYFHQIHHFCQNRHFQRESLCHRIWISAQNFRECSLYSSRSPLSKCFFAISFQFFLRLWYFQRGPLCHLIRLVAKALTNSHHIRHFRESPHFQRAPLKVPKSKKKLKWDGKEALWEWRSWRI